MHADVFRPPQMPILLCASLGTGSQLMFMAIIAIFCAMIGFLSPANRGGLLTAVLLLFVLMGVPAGYYSSSTYKALKGTEWKLTTILTATLYPACIALILFTLNFFIWGQGSSGAIPFGRWSPSSWFGISVPLVFVGAFFGFKAPLKEPPTRTNEIPRQIPLQTWYMGSAFNVLMGGILPFGAIFIELFFIMTSVWLQRFYYVFGFLALVLYPPHHLRRDQHRPLLLPALQRGLPWWWRPSSPRPSASTSLPIIMYFFTPDIIGFVPTLIYFTHVRLLAPLLLVTGTIGFYSCYWFVWTIYSAIKVD